MRNVVNIQTNIECYEECSVTVTIEILTPGLFLAFMATNGWYYIFLALLSNFLQSDNRLIVRFF